MEQNQINLIELERMFAELTSQGWSLSTTLFSKILCQNLALECQNLYLDGKLSPASIGHGAAKVAGSQIRGDLTRWLTEDTLSLAQQQTGILLGHILSALNQTFYLGLKRYEAHFAFYPPGTGYEKHIDNHRGSSARKITFILYLNENWCNDYGGQLSLYSPGDPKKKIFQIEPILGAFVMFRSELFPHEVEECRQPRLSLTGWFRNDNL